MSSSLHGMDDLENTFVLDDSHHLNLVSSSIEADQVVFPTVTGRCLFGNQMPSHDGMSDVFTGHSVLERGSANSDVIEG